MNHYISIKNNWAVHSAKFIINEINKDISNEPYRILLTGGRSAANLYKHINIADIIKFNNIEFYFGDERCVSPDHKDSNYRNAKKNLFNNNITDNIFRIKAETSFPEKETARYSKLLNKKIDLLLLSLGEDGHIASLLPNAKELKNFQDNVLFLPRTLEVNRITIGPKIIKKAKKIIILVSGKNKKLHIANLNKSMNTNELPARLIKNGIWLIDDKNID